mmetsp:Transcript_52396/g.111643  ORF Transcript_52396/g.111643 Transcript_52396/m.111643 type:complete len:217 (-) Transcript_52396:2-652(-)
MLTEHNTTDGEGADCCGTHGNLAASGHGVLFLLLHDLLDGLAGLRNRDHHLGAGLRAWWHSHCDRSARVVGILDVHGRLVVGDRDDDDVALRDEGPGGRLHAVGRSDLALLSRLQVLLKHIFEAVLVVLTPQAELAVGLADEVSLLEDRVFLSTVVLPLARESDLPVALHDLSEVLSLALALTLHAALAWSGHVLIVVWAGKNGCAKVAQDPKKQY